MKFWRKSKIDSKHPPNTWLVSNSMFYFADTLLRQPNKPPNANDIFSLAKLSESILLAEKITTLPIHGKASEAFNDNEIFERLKKIIVDLQLSNEDKSKIIKGLQGSDSLFGVTNKQVLASIISESFNIDNTLALKVISLAPKLIDEDKSLILNVSKLFQRLADHDEFYSKILIDTHITEFQDLKKYWKEEGFYDVQSPVIEAYVRTIIYLMAASVIGINFSPDSFKLPIVNHLNNEMQLKINQFGKKLIAKVEEKNSKSRKALNEEIGFSRFDIEIPSMLSLILKQCRSKDEFIDRALELRNSQKLTKFRKLLAEQDDAVRRGDIQMTKDISEQCNNVFDTGEKKESLGINIINSIDKLKPIVLAAGPILGGALSSDPHLATVLSAIGPAFGLSQKVTEYIANARTMFLQDLTKHLGQIESINTQIKNLFGYPLYDSEISRLQKLNAAYLKSISYG